MPPHESCPQLPVWDRVQISMIKLLEETTLEDILKGEGTAKIN